MIRFSNPLALLLLGFIPFIVWMGLPARGYGMRREAISLAVRLVIVTCLVLSLAGLELSRPSDRLSVVYLVDVSDSMPDQAIAIAEDYVGKGIAGMGPDDQAAVVVFGSQAFVERPMSSSRQFDKITTIPDTTQTNLGEAIRLGLALYPPGTARRMIILSDGGDTNERDQSLNFQDARISASSGVELWALPISVETGSEVLIEGVTVPPRLRSGERFDLNLTIRSKINTTALVQVFAGGQLVYEESAEIQRGTQFLSLPLIAGTPGFIRYTVRITPEKDHFYQNNELAAYTRVEGPPTILLVAPPEGEAMDFQGEERRDELTQLRDALRASGFVVETHRPGDLPTELGSLAAYSAVVLVDVPARDLSQRQMSAVQTYVRDLGGGLVVIGGPTSYGVGGYFRTPLEETLPLDMQIKDEQRRASLAMVFIIDKSGSMTEASGGVVKLELAKEAAARSVRLLNPGDRVGVIAFDETAAWVVPLADLSNPDSVLSGIGSIRSGGGTDILAGVQAMARVFPDDPAIVKHVILLTDGGADPTGIPELVEQLYTEHGITLSTVGVGRDAAPFLPQLAQAGGGRYHFAADPASIPSIFTEETTLATRAYIVEEEFFPRQVSQSTILSGFDRVPPLFGYVSTSAKNASQTILESERGDPILAAWQYGLGRVVAFTSDATGRWAREWVVWDGFPAFWGQAVGYTIAEHARSGLSVSITEREGVAQITVEAQDADGALLNGLQMQANIVEPDGKAGVIDIQQVAPGRYQGEFIPSSQGVYLLRVEGSTTTADLNLEPIVEINETAGWVLTYSPEYRRLESDPDYLSRLVAIAGGRIAPENPGEVFSTRPPAPRSTLPVWPWLLSVATILFPIDVGLRRLVISKSDLVRAWEKLDSKLSRSQASIPSNSRQPGLEALFRAKIRASGGKENSEGLSGGIGMRAGSTAPDTTSPPLATIHSPTPVTEQNERLKEASVEEPDPSLPGPSSSSTTSLLLAKKRARKGGQDDS